MDSTRNPRRVLIIGRYRLVRESLRHLLTRDAAIEVVGDAIHPNDAAAAAGRLRPDIVIFDLDVSVDNEPATVEQVTQIFPGADLILLGPSEASRSFPHPNGGRCRYVYKGVAISAFLQAVKSVVDGDAEPPGAGHDIGSRGSLDPLSDVPLQDLTDREHEILRLLGEGQKNREIASRLLISLNTLKTHIRHIQQKLGTRDRVQTVASALRKGLIS